MTSDGQRPTKYKIYYDVVTYLVTQTAFCFTTAPFVLLTLPASIVVWARVYFYTVAGVIASLAFFASPGKAWLSNKLKKRNQNTAAHTIEKIAAQKQPLLGLPEDPGRDIDEAVEEVKREVELRQRNGSKVEMPTGGDLKKLIESKMGKKL